MTRSFDDQLMESYQLRQKLAKDKYRPNYHFVPPEGRWNDINGTMFWNGTYHVGYLQKIKNGPGEIDFSSWQHISSRDLLHWKYHEAYMDEPLAGAKGDYFNSGDALEGVEVPTIIANMPRRGICIYQCHDENLDQWIPLKENPVIPIDADLPECVVFDPFAWKEGDTYYLLMGNKNYRPGYEGDSTSILKSTDLVHWEYLGPFYKSDRKWTEETEDCACADFFPFGNKHMLLMHTHSPYFKCQYYIGTYENERFYPEINGQLSHLGGGVFGPETLLDDRGRRIFWATVHDARNYEETGWSSIMTLPWVFTPTEDNLLKIAPAEELQNLRYDEQRVHDVSLAAGDELALDALSSDCMEVVMTMAARGAGQFGFKLLCSPDGEEETVVTYDIRRQAFIVDFEKASRDQSLRYHGYTAPFPQTKGGKKQAPPAKQAAKQQIVPYPLGNDGILELNIFVDKSVVEIFVNRDICIVQRVYPTRHDSKRFKLFSKEGEVDVKGIRKWEMDSTNPW